MRLNDADALLEQLESLLNKTRAVVRWDNVIIAIKIVPTIEPEIIRCKDCSKGSDWYTADDGSRYCYCMETSDCRMEDFYCADAERRIDE